ncbi:MAG: SGNH/GDSL hydrolase family protein [Clostridia bacterium]|nr:SGNH/GDSL hydrolase family protein [Clostridia bacterium]
MLNNTSYRLTKEKKLTVGYFGGSITEGAGASVWDETSWRANITRYLRAKYPEAEIKEVNAAIGGTGTDLGFYRCEHDLLAGNPDLVFIEFATNDSGLCRRDQLRYYESCLRQIMEHDKTTEIVVVFTTTKGMERIVAETGDRGSRTVQAMLAYHYGLDMVDLGQKLNEAVLLAGGDWLRYTTDETHPNDDGYLICTETMRTALERLIPETADAITERVIPVAVSPEIPHGEIVEIKDLLPIEGWHFVDKRFKRRFPYYVTADGVGSELTYTFEGTALGLYWIQDRDSGKVSLSLDGGEPVTVSAWDSYCKSYSRAGYVIPFVDLERGTHTVTVRVLAEKDEESLGNTISLFAFMVGK